MKTRLLAAIGCTLLFAGYAASASADTIEDPLHIFCVAPATCSDNGTITPIQWSPGQQFGFLKSPNTGSGTFYLDVLIPNNVAGANSESFSVTGTHTGNTTVSANLFSTTAWTIGNLTTYMGRSTSPPNPLNAWLPSTNTYQPSATGYFVYDLKFGTVNFSANDPTFLSSFSFPAGTIIAGFFCGHVNRAGACTSWVSTAQSAAGLITTPSQVPEPESLTLLGVGLLGAGLLGRRRQKKTTKSA